MKRTSSLCEVPILVNGRGDPSIQNLTSYLNEWSHQAPHILMLLLQLLYLKLDMRAVEEAVNLLPRC